MASNVNVVNLSSGTGDVQAYTGMTTLYGFSLRESAATAAAAALIVRDGTAATDPILAVVQLAGNGSTTHWFGPQGVRVNTGVFVDRESGTTEGTFYLG